MIHLTRLNNQPLAVNSDLIKFVEAAPDTVISLVTGEKIVVRESAQQVLDRILTFRRSIVAGMAYSGGDPSVVHAQAATVNVDNE